MDTHYAPAQRASGEDLREEIRIFSDSPATSALLEAVPGLLLVLDATRQVIALNTNVLCELGIDDPQGVLGLRYGEVLECVHAHELPHGCGTTKFCATCGLAVANVVCSENMVETERVCALSVNRGGVEAEICLAVRARPFRLDDAVFTLVFIKDITRDHAAAALQRVFFHDINNLVGGIAGSIEMMSYDGVEPQDIVELQALVSRLTKEIEIQRVVSASSDQCYQVSCSDVPLGAVATEVERIFSSHPVGRGRRLKMAHPVPDDVIHTDWALVMRIVTNMLLNASEASDVGQEVRVSFGVYDAEVAISVWNHQPVPNKVRHRIFQKHFSTKEGAGRGVGTYSMKTFAELLGGSVAFKTSVATGTLFEFRLPRACGPG